MDAARPKKTELAGQLPSRSRWTGEIIKMNEIIKNIGLIVAAVTAIYGINAWRREFRGKKQYELAEEVLTLRYDCRKI